MIIFFRLHSTTLTTHTYSHSMNTDMKTLPYEYFRRLTRQILEIDEVTIDASLSTGTSPTIECTTLLNPRIFASIGSRTHDFMYYRGSCKLLCSCSMYVSLLCSCCMCFCALLHAFCAVACICMLTAALQLHMQSLLSCFLSFFFL